MTFAISPTGSMTADLSSASNNKLLANKSAFQAWKCVSFGCSLLAMVLLLSKWYEVSTDLQLLLSIERLLSSSQVANSTLSWPPVPLEVLLPAANETSFGPESMESNGTMLMSHMHISLSRELNGNQLLRAEIEAFAAEFRNAKSTLSLSSLLVSVYIVSWILMTLAINDTRILNDISLRNMLLLSVFGAIDMAASVGFVMVRLIMYSVKNHSFSSEMLATVGLKDAPVRLSADQLTAFTALRLIAMRSCSAYIDVYVSVLVALLTLLRLYAILKALAYYKQLRRVTDFQQIVAQQHQHQQQVANGAGNLPELAEQKPQIWSAGFYGTNNGHHLISSSANGNHTSRQQRNLRNTPQSDYADQYFRLAPVQLNGASAGPGNALKTGTFRFQQASSSSRPEAGGKLIIEAASSQQSPDKSEPDKKRAARTRVGVPAPAESPALLVHQYQSASGQTKISVKPPPRVNRPASRQKFASSQAPKLLVVNGRTHRLLAGESPAASPQVAVIETSQPEQVEVKRLSAHNSLEECDDLERNHVERAASSAGSEGEDSVQQVPVFDFVAGGQKAKTATRESAASDQELLCDQERRRRAPVGLPTGYNTLRSNGTTYTLLSAHQLDKLGRKLAASAGGTARAHTANKYRLVARYKPVPEAFPGAAVAMQPGGAPQKQRARRENSLPDDNESSSSSSSTGAPTDDSDASAILGKPINGSGSGSGSAAGSRQRRQPRLLGVRQSEELVADMMRQKVFEVADSNQNLLLGKYLILVILSSGGPKTLKLSPENQSHIVPRKLTRSAEYPAYKMARPTSRVDRWLSSLIESLRDSKRQKEEAMELWDCFGRREAHKDPLMTTSRSCLTTERAQFQSTSRLMSISGASV